MRPNTALTLAVAPMMDWTDRHCRVFHRRLNPTLLLFTEMVTTGAILYGDAERHLAFSAEERPLILQLGGSDPAALARCAAIAAGYGYDGVNLNVGCPSDRVQGGRFGACLMREPQLVGECLAAMAEGGLKVSLKCRIGVDDQDPEVALSAVAEAAKGVDAIWVHARKAWLKGLSPAQNRTVPPLDYGRVYRLKAERQGFVGINGGFETEAAIAAQTGRVDGVMVGRAAYRDPALLSRLSGRVGMAERAHRLAVARSMVGYADDVMRRGGKLSHVTRHMLGLFHGEPGARTWRRRLTEEARLPGATPRLLDDCVDAITATVPRAA
ncbi:MAG: tRNA dihydrouridine(20/20a) synthase DusA [Pseudomonadota bacterium]